MRARAIKPGFYKNEELMECSFPARLLFPGLWMLADREGRLEDRPKRIKIEVFPGDNLDIEALLSELEQHGFIVRYSIDGKKYIWITSFLKHQNPHTREQVSVIPPCPEMECARHNLGTAEAQPRQCSDTAKAMSSPADSPFSDSPFSDSLLPPKNAGGEGGDPPKGPPECPHREIVALYHEKLPELPKVREWGKGCQKLLHARWTERKERQCLDWWREYFENIRHMDWLMGKVARSGAPPFMADLQWLVSPTNMTKVLNGRYASRASPKEKQSVQSLADYMREMGDDPLGLYADAKGGVEHEKQ
jgi:hypothetical protein